MNTYKNTLIILFLTFILTNNTFSQTERLNYFKIEISGEKNQLIELMNKQYKKEFYANEHFVYSIDRINEITEIIEFDSSNTPTNLYILKGDSLFINNSAKYEDSNLGELSSEEQNQIKDFYQINRDIKKEIYGFDCFQVIMKDPRGGDTNVEMFVTEKLPNLPNHFPLASNILNAEPLEINMNLMGNKIKVEVVEFERDVDIEKKMKLKFNKAIAISNQEYIKMKNM